MFSAKKRTVPEYQKCGELMFAAKRNKIAISCNFCHQMFEQLQGFLRHLHIIHTDKVEFIKQFKEVEVYALEELFETVDSCAKYMERTESDESKAEDEWLNEVDHNWLNEGIDPVKDTDQYEAVPAKEVVTQTIKSEENINERKYHLNVKNENDTSKKTDEPNLINVSILKALEDCDIKDDIYISLFDSETRKNANDVKKQEIKTDRKNDLISATLTQKCINDLEQKRSKSLKDTNSFEDFPNFSKYPSKNKYENMEILEKNNSKNVIDKMDNFEVSLEGLENALDKDILNSNSVSGNSTKSEKIDETSQIADKKSEFEQAIIDLVEEASLMIDVNYDANVICSNNEVIFNDLDKEFQMLSEVKAGKENDSINSQTFNLDLTKALVDALDSEDLDLLSKQLEDVCEDPLNENTIDLLELQLEETKIEKDTKFIPREGEIDQPLNEAILNVLERELESELSSQTNQISNLNSRKNVLEKENLMTVSKSELKNIESKVFKDLKTNFDAINKNHKALDVNMSNPATNMVLKESKSNNINQTKTCSQLLLKENKDKLPYITNKASTKPHDFDMKNQRLSNETWQKKTLKKDNQLNKNFNIRKNIKDKFTSCTSFINTERGNKTLIKRDPFLFNNSSKTRLKGRETPLKNITYLREEKTALIHVEQSSKTQENSSLPITVSQKTLHFNNKKEIESKKTQGRSNKLFQSNIILQTPPNDNCIISNQGKCINSKNTVSSNETILQPKPVTDVCHLNDGPTNPLTTPPNRRLKNVTVKLHRCTPDKLSITNKNHKINVTEQIAERIKLPQDITVGSQNNKPPVVQHEIIGTSKHSTCNRPNVTESSLRSISNEGVNKQSIVKHQELKVETTSSKNENILRVRQRLASSDIVTNTKKVAYKENPPYKNKTPVHSNLDYKSYPLIRSTRKKEVLQRMRNIKKRIFKSMERNGFLKNNQSSVQKYKKRENLVIESVKILPNLDKATLNPLNIINFTKGNANFSATSTNTNSSKGQVGSEISINNEAENVCKTVLKRRRVSSSPLDKSDSAKRQEVSPKYKQSVKKELDLSESFVNLSQCDLTANHLNIECFPDSDIPEDKSVANELNSVELERKDTEVKDEDSLIIQELLNQVKNEILVEPKLEKQSPKNKAKTLNSLSLVKDFNYAKDMELLDKFGLKVIKLPEIEDLIFLEDRDKMHGKARKFAVIYQNWQRIWSTKNCSKQTYKLELDNNLKGLINELYLAFNVELSIVELKRLVNLISIWFAQNVSSKFIEKRKISETTNRFFSYFSYIPKTIKRFFYCEFCEEYFNTEHRYYTHRIVHTGAIYPYVCQKCFFGCKRIKQLKNHESSCTKAKLNVNHKNKYICLVCEELFDTFEILYKHNKKH